MECSEQEVKLGMLLWKVEASRDYETREVKSWEANIQGQLTLDRSGYDRNYGIVDDTWHIYTMRYNIWDKSHTATVCGQNNVKADGNKTCTDINPNSTCDMNAKRCAMPYTDRTVRPIVFFLIPALPLY